MSQHRDRMKLSLRAPHRRSWPSLVALGLAPLAFAACGPETPRSVVPPLPTSEPTAQPTTSAEVAAPPKRVLPKPPFSMDDLLDLERSMGVRAVAGDRFVYLSDSPGTFQAFQGAATKGAELARTSQLTSFADRVAGVTVSEDGKRIVLSKDQGGDENFQLYVLELPLPTPPKATPPSLPAARALTSDPKVRHMSPELDPSGKYIAFTSNRRNGKDMDLYVEPLSDKPGALVGVGKPVLELAGSFEVGAVGSGRVVLIEQRSGFDQDLWLTDFAGKKKELLTKHEGDVRWGEPHFSADGKRLFVLTDAGSDFVGIHSLDLATKKAKPLVTDRHDVSALAVCAVGKASGPDALPKGATDAVYFALNEAGTERVYAMFLDKAGKELKRSQLPLAGVVQSLSCAPGGRVAYASVDASTHPAEVYRLDGEAGTAVRMTDGNRGRVDEKQLASEELLTLQASDGVELATFYYAKPAAPGEKRPVVLSVHGGPESQAQPSFSPLVQYLVASGYGVALPNVRGSTGYGKAFTHLDDKRKREDSVRDLSEIGKHLAARADVDPKRIALVGGSYGGYMVLAGLTLYPEQWAAGIDIVGIANFRSFLEKTAPYRRALREAEYGSLKDDGEFLDRISPLARVDRIQAPLLVVHGKNDPRVPVGEAAQIAEALQKRGRPVELLVFDDEGHGIAKRKNRGVAFPKMVTFLNEHVGERP
jgi:dipeptidyl aminopeptidase/acylaminoacyl peptidase